MYCKAATWYNNATESRRAAQTAAGVTPKGWSLRCKISLTPRARRSGAPSEQPTPKLLALPVAESTRRMLNVAALVLLDGVRRMAMPYGNSSVAGGSRIRYGLLRVVSNGRKHIPNVPVSANGPARLSAVPSHGEPWSGQTHARRAERAASRSVAPTATTPARWMCAGSVVRVTSRGIVRSRRPSSNYVTGKDLATRRGRA